MLVVVSPAKRLDWSERQVDMTTPMFQKDANRLASHARQLTLAKLKSLMDLSDDLAKLNRDRFKTFADAPEADMTRPALYAFAGDTFQGFDAASLDADGLARAQSHMRILSGLYGVLRPLDAIQPYRLEMGSRLKTRRGTSLYDYWGQDIAKALNETAEELGTDLLVNAASQEYFGAVDLKALKPRVVTPQFYELKNGEPRIVSFFAKKARGSIARFIVENRITTVDGLKDFDLGGYRCVDQTGDTLIFHRTEAAAA
ncbi:MAG: peroxide stress protein YaaA [Paracoccaceae bacterium]|nr:peroxide stress protein YaaA [Paracoccaceae bacterium]